MQRDKCHSLRMHCPVVASRPRVCRCSSCGFLHSQNALVHGWQPLFYISLKSPCCLGEDDDGCRQEPNKSVTDYFHHHRLITIVPRVRSMQSKLTECTMQLMKCTSAWCVCRCRVLVPILELNRSKGRRGIQIDSDVFNHAFPSRARCSISCPLGVGVHYLLRFIQR